MRDRNKYVSFDIIFGVKPPNTYRIFEKFYPMDSLLLEITKCLWMLDDILEI